MKNKLFVLIGGIALLAAVAATSSLLTLYLARPTSTATPRDYHAWIHEELKMTDEQERRLLSSEERYIETQRHLSEVIRLANRELADAIGEDRSNSDRVQAKVALIHDAMGQLQRATLQHIFEMKEVLEPAQYDKLMELTKEALSHQAGTE